MDGGAGRKKAIERRSFLLPFGLSVQFCSFSACSLFIISHFWKDSIKSINTFADSSRDDAHASPFFPQQWCSFVGSGGGFICAKFACLRRKQLPQLIANKPLMQAPEFRGRQGDFKPSFCGFTAYVLPVRPAWKPNANNGHSVANC
jgi:hypothetical protein